MSNGGNKQPGIDASEHIGPNDTGDNIDAKKVAIYGWYISGNQWTRVQVDSSGVVQTSGSGGGGVVLPAAPLTGQVTVGTSAVQLPSNALTEGVIVRALSTNSVSIYIGPSGVTTSTGHELLPGESTSVAVSNTNAIYAISGTASQGLCFVGS